jgi:4-hydroxybenzoate polyprenyltransferase
VLLSSFVVRHSSFFPVIRTLLILGRISNLPTVWSNCLAAWLIAGGGPWSRFGILCVGASLLYTGGMFLNDAFDVEFDRNYRTERPIPAGQIGLRWVWVIGLALLLLGWLTMLPMGQKASLLAAGLLACILVYDAIHKRTPFAPFLMAGCRFLLYLVAALVAKGELSALLFWGAGALAAYILGISYLARGESAPIPIKAWPVALLFAPIVLALAVNPSGSAIQRLVAAVTAAWVFWCLRGPFLKIKKPLASAVPGLLAGIVLIDWLASGVGFSATACIFLALFVLALALQRIAPAS